MTAASPSSVAPEPSPDPGPAGSPVDLAVVVGRFQPFHRAHLALVRRALAAGRHCVVVIGSAHQARTPKNPFTWQERAEMVRLALDDGERARIGFLPMRDYYDQARWVQAVRAAVEGWRVDDTDPPPRRRTGLVGHFKDATSGYLRDFPGWALVAVGALPGLGGTAIRDTLFAAGADDLEPTLAAIAGELPPTTTAFLRAWAHLPYLDALRREWESLRTYHEAWASAPYPPVFVTVDALVRCAGHVLLIRRGHPPGVGLYATPGGFVEPRETLLQSALRELVEETRLPLLPETLVRHLVEVAVFDHPDRSLRGRTITHAHHIDLGEMELPEVQGGDDAAAAQWVPIAELTALEDRFHDDHFHLLDHFLGLTQEGR